MSLFTPKPYFEFFCPVKVMAGHKALEHIPFELAALQARRPLIITDRGVVSAGLLDHVKAVFLGTDSAPAAVFDDVPPDSSIITVRRAAEAYRAAECDAIIAVGGGSVIDTSKAVNVLVSENADDLTKFSGAHNLRRPLRPLFVIPTTAGTGSETTMVAVISDTDKGVKVPFTSPFLLPNVAVLDPRMTLSLPPNITAMTAMDAMTHAIEAYTCLAANPLSDAYATTAVRLISENLLKVIDAPDNEDARLALAQASTMAGIAFSNAMVGLVHSLGHSLGAVCHLPHGLCMSLLLPYALQYNKDVNGDRMADLLLPLAGAEVYSATPPGAQRTDKFITTLCTLRDALYQRCGLPRTLQETERVRQDQLPQIAELALDDGSIIYNPKEADRAQLLSILEDAWA